MAQIQAAKVGFLVLLGLTGVSCSSPAPPPASPSASDQLIILWDKGYVIEEDEAIEAAVDAWKAASGETAKLSFYNSGEIAPKILRANKAGLSPDILFAAKSVYPVSDWQGKLAEVTDLVTAGTSNFLPDALAAAQLYGAEVEGYYAVPLNQSVIPIHYWSDLLEQADYSTADIPTDWDGFWSFWQGVQDRLREQGMEVYALGLPHSRAAQDSYRLFEQVLVAYDVQLLDASGQLQVDRPEVREGIIRCLRWYTDFYQQGYVPPNAATWLDPDNNRNFLNRQVLMTPNPTLSIPAAVRNDEALYFERMGTTGWPERPDGSPLPHLLDIRQAVIFADAPHIDEAKDFLRYLIQPEVINEFLKTSYGRFMPASDALRSDPFWRDPADPHISATTEMVLSGPTQPYSLALNPAYGIVMESNIWGEALQSIVEAGVSPEQAADTAIEQIQQIFDDWS